MDNSHEETRGPHVSPFETIRQEAEDGSEYWSARELAKLLDYVLWQKFRNVIEKAKKACHNSGQVVSDHFIQTDKMVILGSGARRKVEDYFLSRYACYLIVRAPVIGRRRMRRITRWDNACANLFKMEVVRCQKICQPRKRAFSKYNARNKDALSKENTLHSSMN